MALENAFNKLKREIGIKRCIIIDGNVGDIFLNKNYCNLNIYLKSILEDMNYDDIIFWDKIEGTKDTLDNLIVVENNEKDDNKDGYEDYDDGGTDDDTKKDAAKANAVFSINDGKYRNLADFFPIVMQNMLNPKKKVAFVLNWSDYLFSGSQHSEEDRNYLTILGKAIRDRDLNSYVKDSSSSDEVNKSTVILVTNKLSLLPVSLYQSQPEVSIITLPKPDRLERESILKKLQNKFAVTLEEGKDELCLCDKFNEYVDMLSDFTNREIFQLAALSRKEEKMTFEKLFLLFKYGEKDNPWEKLAYSEVKEIKKKLAERVKGQDEAIEKVEKVVVKAYMGMTGLHKASSRSMPKGVLFFVGPTGVGKTELSKALAKFLFGDEDACIRFDMSEYAQQNSDQKLIGAPPGYVGYEEGGQLTNAIKEKPFSVILFDEIEKAAKPNPRILDIFLQILEDGRLTDSKGETVYFSESVIIFTSNLGAAEVNSSSDDPKAEFIKKVKTYFNEELQRPELLGRIGYNNIVPFNFINDKEIQSVIASSKLKSIKDGIKDKYHINLNFDNESTFIKYILKKVDASKGGRDILNALSDTLLDELAMWMFNEKREIDKQKKKKEEKNIVVTVSEEEGIHFDFE